VLLFHHDPLHSDDFLDELAGGVVERMSEFDKTAEWAELAKERCEVALHAAGSATRVS